ncbi:MAG TPA: TonB-dependent receptor [Flavisolibacter sp.]|nr:TonB-dependent receptor [Flavisolibacter sp.]
MKKFIGLFSILMAFTLPLCAQDAGLKGNLQDTTEKRALSNAVVSLLHKKDSTLASFTRSDKNGNFDFQNLTPGKYVLLITFPKFADYADEIEIKEGQKDLGKVPLTQKSVLLKEVVIRSGQAIRIKGDTTEFNADSFVVKEGATVEDLMKKLPGFQVNSKGEITAQGKRVDKVLVDGEEFFGDDPTMATQNLSAKAVDKVQVFDTKSEQQQLTGITSGSEGKTINIKLKENSKKGAFGKVIAGSDFDKLVDAKGLYNRFVGKKKTALYATRSGVNTGSLNWEDRQKLGVENDMEYDEIGGYYYSYGSADEFSDWSLKGLPTATTGGALFSNKWNADKNNLNLSYRYNRLETENVASGFTQGFYKERTLEKRSTNSYGTNEQHAINGKYEWKMDSLTSFKFTTNAIYKQTAGGEQTHRDYSSDNGSSRIDNQKRVNENNRIQNDNSLVYKQLFKKKNRQLLTTLRFGITEDDNEGLSDVRSAFDKDGDGNIDSVAIVDQMRLFEGRSQTIGAKVTFSEPITTKLNLVLDYAHNRNNSNSYQNTYNQNGNGKYDVLDESYSNNFDMNAYSHSTMAILRYTDKKVRFAAGTGLSTVKLKLLNLDSKEKRNYDFLNLTPQASFNYAFKQQTNWSLNYRGTTRQPSINQLQPLKDNTNPLFIQEGNPDLKVGFNHNLSTFFHSYKVLSGRGIFASASFNMYENAITTASTLDLSTGKRTSRPVNVNGNYNWFSWGEIRKNGGEKKLGRGINMEANGGRNINFLNNEKNTTDYQHIEFGFNLNYDFPEKYSFEFNPQIGKDFSSTRSILDGTRKTSYLTYGGRVNGMVMLPGKLELTSDCNFDLREGLDAFGPATNIILWNANLSKKIFKKKDGKIILEARDLLDQNKGFNRNINSNFITEERFSRIGQYFLLKFEWSFNKMPGSK